MTNILTFKDLYTQALVYLDKAGDTGQALSMVKYAIQAMHEKRLTTERWNFMLWPDYITFNFVTGKRRYILHPLVQFLTDFRNDSTKQIMKEVPTRARFQDWVQDSKFHYEWVRTSPVASQPAAGTPVTISGSGRIIYTDSTGLVRDENITNANTAVAPVEIIQVTNLDANLAQLAISDALGVQLLLNAGEAGRNFPQITLFGDGVTGEVGKYRFYKKPGNLVLDNDIPDIPYPYSRILVYDALLELQAYADSPANAYWLKQQNDLYTQMQQAYQEGEGEGSETRKIQEVDTYGG